MIKALAGWIIVVVLGFSIVEANTSSGDNPRNMVHKPECIYGQLFMVTYDINGKYYDKTLWLVAQGKFEIPRPVGCKNE